VNDFSAYEAALAADKAWSDELILRFGKNAGDIRYTEKGAGSPGSELRRLCDAKLAADKAWQQTRLCRGDAKTIE